jgi:hypothetical protein
MQQSSSLQFEDFLIRKCLNERDPTLFDNMCGQRTTDVGNFVKESIDGHILAPSNDGHITPLHYLAMLPTNSSFIDEDIRISLLQDALLKMGADPLARTAQGYTPLEFAIIQSSVHGDDMRVAGSLWDALVRKYAQKPEILQQAIRSEIIRDRLGSFFANRIRADLDAAAKGALSPSAERSCEMQEVKRYLLAKDEANASRAWQILCDKYPDARGTGIDDIINLAARHGINFPEGTWRAEFRNARNDIQIPRPPQGRG